MLYILHITNVYDMLLLEYHIMLHINTMLYYVMLYDAVLCYILYLIIPYMIERLYYTVCMYTYVYIYVCVSHVSCCGTVYKHIYFILGTYTDIRTRTYVHTYIRTYT